MSGGVYLGLQSGDGGLGVIAVDGQCTDGIVAGRDRSLIGDRTDLAGSRHCCADLHRHGPENTAVHGQLAGRDGRAADVGVVSRNGERAGTLFGQRAVASHVAGIGAGAAWLKITSALFVILPWMLAVFPCKVPALTVVPPAYELAPDRVKVPAPSLVTVPLPLMLPAYVPATALVEDDGGFVGDVALQAQGIASENAVVDDGATCVRVDTGES